jgi:hypothetical protein
VTGSVDLGQTYRYRQTVKDANGVPANAGTVTVTITLPDGTTTAPTVVNSSTGIYDIAYTTTQSGLHNLFGSATGGVLSSEFDKWEDSFTVETPGRIFIGLDEASQHLRAAGIITTDADREQLRWLCAVACSVVEDDLGLIIARRTITDTFDGGNYELKLQAPPRAADGGSINIITVVESGTTLGVGDYVLRKRHWRLCRGSTTYLTRWAFGYENISVTYAPGCVDPPKIARKVGLNAVQGMWETSQQASHPLLEEAGVEAVFAAVGALTNYELGAYNSLRSVNNR